MSESIPFECDPPIRPDVKRLLVVGGSFDPPHGAHVQLAFDAAKKASCDWIVFVPAARSPFKEEQPTPAEHRLAMLRLALEGREHCSISEFELKSPPPSYTINTLHAMRLALGENVELRLLIGSDQLKSFDRWRESEEILRIAKPIVLLRPPDDRKTLLQNGVSEDRLKWIADTPVIDLDSTSIRARAGRGQDVSDQVGPAVGAYIRQNGLYQNR